MPQEPFRRPDTHRSIDDLDDLDWRDYDEIQLVRTGDAVGLAIYAQPRLVSDMPRGATSPLFSPRRLLIVVDDPMASGKGARVRKLLGIVPDDLGVVSG